MSLFAIGAAAVLWTTPGIAQQNGLNSQGDARPDSTRPAASDSVPPRATAPSWISTQKRIEVQHIRPNDQRGINMFETPKDDAVPYQGFKMEWGAAFTQQFQGLDHSNTAAVRMVDTVNANQLVDIGPGFNNANANLYLNAQLAPGIRVALTSYLSARHHNETWVKDGFLLIDDSPIKVAALENLMKYLTVKVGHFEINYGDAHFRRTDNGNALYNPFVGNLIMDAFTTEIGGEVYVRANGIMAMGSVTGGEIRGNVKQPNDRSFAYIGKIGFDRQLTDNLRARLTGSVYTTRKSINNTLYAGDRAGSRYYYVLENTQATESGQFTSGLVNPGFRRSVTAMMLNPFVKVGGLEFFGVAERAQGRSADGAPERTWNQYAGDVVYRFLADERLFVGGRYNTAKGELAGIPGDVNVDRVQLGAGWFLTPGVLLKGEWVNQKYNDFPSTDIRNGGKFDGFMVEGVVAF